ncbi:MAG TPA: hypothetical protein VNX28_15140 [Gemmataceae bacterium]|jgi:hypothetical protein|nr:hypothetical protein [Gemmataceae bacterium]
MTFYSRALVVFLCFWSLSASSAQEEPSALAAQVRDLIRQLGDKEFPKRDAARKALVNMGTKAIPIIDQLPPPRDLETNLRLRKVRYQIIGYVEDIEKYLTAMPAKGNEPIRTELTPELKGVIAASSPKSGNLLLTYIQNPGHRLHRQAINALVQSWSHLTSKQIDAYFRHALVLESRARPQFPQKVPAVVGMTYYCRYGWSGWPPDKNFHLKTRTLHYLDGKTYGAPFDHQGPIATTGWISTKDLSTGSHSYHFTLDYEFTHQGTTTRGQLRSRDFSLEMLPATAPDTLIAQSDPDLDKLVRKHLRFIDRDPSAEELFLGQDHVVDPWLPQVSWKEGATQYALRVPTWKVEQSLPVDLCFETEILDVRTGKIYPAETLILRKDKTAYGYLCPNDVQAFAKGRTGFVEVELRLTPSRALALGDPDITRYYFGTIRSGRLRMKITSGF